MIFFFLSFSFLFIYILQSHANSNKEVWEWSEPLPPGSSVDKTGQVHQAASSHKDKTLNQWKEEDIKNALDYWHNQDLVGLR